MTIPSSSATPEMVIGSDLTSMNDWTCETFSSPMIQPFVFGARLAFGVPSSTSIARWIFARLPLASCQRGLGLPYGRVLCGKLGLQLLDDQRQAVRLGAVLSTHAHSFGRVTVECSARR